MKLPFRKPAAGFTLIEIMVAVSIIALLFAISVGTYASVQKKGRDARRLSDLKIIQSYLEQYHADQGFYPASLASPLTSSVGQPAPSPSITPRTYLNQLPVDPSSGTIYGYQAQPAGTCDNSSGSLFCISYRLCARLESPPSGSTCSFGPVAPTPGAYNFEVSPP